MVWWVWPNQGTANGWDTIATPTTSTTTIYTTPTIRWSSTGATTLTTSSWSNATTTGTSNYYGWQQQAQRAIQNQMSQLYLQEQFAAEALNNMGLREARQRMAAPAILRAREAPVAQRARDLLLSFLSDEQRRTFEANGWFIVVGGQSGRRYRIHGGSYAGNIALLAANDNNKVEATFCGHCDHSIPLGDQLLAQKVMLEVDEPAYIALANRRNAA